MITEQTLFILGAGASAPYGYPTGHELRRSIIYEFPERAAHDEFIGFDLTDIDEIVREREHITKKAKELSYEFSKSRPPSIDLFLSRRQQFNEIGRRAIAQIIFENELDSKFEYDMEDIRQDWYSLLYHRMTETLTDPDSYDIFAENKVSFITFNYDRSLEHFLYGALTSSFDIPLQTTKTKDLFPFNFIHVYGKLADLDWENPDGMEYRGCFSSKMIENIKIIYDDENKKSLEKTIQKEITKAKRIFFLGFGFAKENMDILGIPKILHHEPRIFATARGWTENEIMKIRKYLRSDYKNPDPRYNNPYVKNLDCRKLLREYL